MESVMVHAGLAIGAIVLVIAIRLFLHTQVVKTALLCVPMAGCHAALFLALVPLTDRARELDWGPVCRSNLEGIGHAITMYQSVHDGKLPEDLDTLVTDGQPAKLLD